MNWLYYLLESNLYLLIFYGFYRAFLKKETFNTGNRYYLLATSLFSFLLPILQIGILKGEQISYSNSQLISNDGIETIASASNIPATPTYISYLYIIYLLIALCFLVKLISDFAKIINLWLRAKKQRSGEITVVELQEQTAFSFFNLLFIHPQLAEKQVVLKHEMVHIKQKHSIDIIFFEILQVICWFNPIIYFIKNDIKLLHEYIADELSTGAGLQKHEYAMFLIENSFGITPTRITNQFFNQSILKRRINMLNKKRTTGWARLKFLLTMPLICGMLSVSTVAFTKEYGYIDLLPEKSNAEAVYFQNSPKILPKKQEEPATKPKNKSIQKKIPHPKFKSKTIEKVMVDSIEERVINRKVNRQPTSRGELRLSRVVVDSITKSRPISTTNIRLKRPDSLKRINLRLKPLTPPLAPRKAMPKISRGNLPTVDVKEVRLVAAATKKDDELTEVVIAPTRATKYQPAKEEFKTLKLKPTKKDEIIEVEIVPAVKVIESKVKEKTNN